MVHHNVLSGHIGILEENLSIITIHCDLVIGILSNQNPSIVSQNDLFMHFLVMSRNGQITTYGFSDIMGANSVLGANYTVTTPFFKPLLIF